MRIISNTRGTSTRLTYLFQDPPEVVGGLQQVETKATTLLDTSDELFDETVNLIYQITRAMLTNLRRGLFTEKQDDVSVSRWLDEIFGEEYWPQSQRNDRAWPNADDLGQVRDRITAFVSRLVKVEFYEKILEAAGRSPEAGPVSGLFTVYYLNKPDAAAQAAGTWRPVINTRVVKEIPIHLVNCLNHISEIQGVLLIKEDTQAGTSVFGGARREYASERTEVTHPSNDSLTAAEEWVHPGSAIDYRNVDFSKLNEDQKSLVKGTIYRVMSSQARTLIRELFTPARPGGRNPAHRARETGS